jgi:hypothetical protein
MKTNTRPRPAAAACVQPCWLLAVRNVTVACPATYRIAIPAHCVHHPSALGLVCTALRVIDVHLLGHCPALALVAARLAHTHIVARIPPNVLRQGVRGPHCPTRPSARCLTPRVAQGAFGAKLAAIWCLVICAVASASTVRNT